MLTVLLAFELCAMFIAAPLAAKGLPIEALQSVQALAQSRREYLRAVYDYDVAQFSLYRAIGAPVMRYSEQIVPPPAARPIPE